MTARSFEWGVILDENTIAEHGEVARIDHLVAAVNRSPEYDIDDLEFARRMERVGHRRVDAVDGRREAVGVRWIVVVIEHLHFGEAHEENTAVSTTLAVPLNFLRRRPFDVELTIAELLFCADVSGFRNT